MQTQLSLDQVTYIPLIKTSNNEIPEDTTHSFVTNLQLVFSELCYTSTSTSVARFSLLP